MSEYRVFLSYPGTGERFWGTVPARSPREAAQTARREAQNAGHIVTAARAERVER